MKSLILIFHFLFLILIFNLPSAFAWKMPIEVAADGEDGGKVYNRLVVGVEAGATDGFDNLWDAPALDSHPDPDSPVMLRAYLLSRTAPTPPGPIPIDRLWKDIRGPAKGDTAWEITVASVPAGKSVVINWDAPQGLLKKGERLVLRDNNATDPDGGPMQTDIMQASNYTFISRSEEPRSLYLTLSKEPAESRRSGGGSGFGCGMVRADAGSGPQDGGTAATGMAIILSPLLLWIFRRYRSCATH